MAVSQGTSEGLVQQGFFQIFKCSGLLLVNGFKALGFFAERIQHFDNARLFLY
ncbi:MAG: hypothetical protein ACYC9L_16580 [Sulfuricaulis sp.]